MGLREPTDLTAWHRWQSSRHRLRRLRHGWRSERPEQLVLSVYGTEPRLLVALDSRSPTSHAALLEPLRHLPVSFAVLSSIPTGDLNVTTTPPTTSHLPGNELPSSMRSMRAAISLGSYMPCGHLAHQWSQQLGVPQYVVQHGALTPFMAPLPEGANVFAWTESDANFWRSGRTDGRHVVVGSQLLWRAAGAAHRDGPDLRDQGGPNGALTYLGQMHGAELSRTRLARAAASFCHEHGATYRPHPSERDKLSRLAHASYRRLGIRVDGTDLLAGMTNPVVSVFSTGVLEAACQGRSAWVDFPRPPAWLGEFWERYGMQRFGRAPTSAPAAPAIEPARRIAQVLTKVVQ